MSNAALSARVHVLSDTKPEISQYVNEITLELDPRKNEILGNPAAFYQQLAKIGEASAKELSEITKRDGYPTIVDYGSVMDIKEFLRTDTFRKVFRPFGETLSPEESIHVTTVLPCSAFQKSRKSVFSAETEAPVEAFGTLDRYFRESRVKPIVATVEDRRWINVRRYAADYYSRLFYDTDGCVLEADGSRGKRRFDVEGRCVDIAKCNTYDQTGFATCTQIFAVLMAAYRPQKSHFRTHTTMSSWILLANKKGVELPPFFNGTFYVYHGNIYSRAVDSVSHELVKEAFAEITPYTPQIHSHPIDIIRMTGKRCTRDLEGLLDMDGGKLSYSEMLVRNVAVHKLRKSSQGSMMLEFCLRDLPHLARTKTFSEIKSDAIEYLTENPKYLAKSA